MNKVVNSIKEAIKLTGIQDGMTVSFHHHLRNGDYVLNMVLEELSALGIKNLTVNASSLFDVHKPIVTHVKNKTVVKISTDYISAELGRIFSGGIMDNPIEFRPRWPSRRHCIRQNTH